jgi:hypothetical protein
LFRFFSVVVNGYRFLTEQTGVEKRSCYLKHLYTFIVSMKKATALLAFLVVTSLQLRSQTTVVELKSFTVIEQRKIELNGGFRSSVGGKSRVFIKIDLPENTKEWYYSFTTTAGESGTANLNLALQLSSMLVDPSGLTATALKAVKIPKGTSSADVYLCDRKNIDLFNVKADNNGGTFNYYIEGTVTNTTEALVRVDDVKVGTWYLGLKNPATWDAITLFIEVVAIVEEKKIIAKTADQEKAELYGNMGWKAYERGEYDKCLELSNEALKYNSELGWVHSNIGLVKLIKGEMIAAVDCYAKAIVLFKKQSNPKYWFGECSKDLNNLISKHGQIEGAKDILETITAEHNKF